MFNTLFLVIIVLLFSVNIHGFIIKSKLIYTTKLYSNENDIKEWLVKQGGKNEDIKIDFHKNNNDKVTVVVNGNISKNDVLLTIPYKAIIDVTTASILALFIITEKYNNKNSKYSCYINTLPSVTSNIFSYDNNQLELVYKSTTRNIQKQISVIDEDSELLRNAITNSDNDNLPTEDCFSIENFRWAIGVVKSKCLYIDNKLTLIPGMDCIEHDPFATNEPYIGNDGFFGTKVIKLSAGRDYKSGDKVFMSYGVKSSAECLEDHGIVPDIPITDSSCEMAVSIDDSDVFSGDKINILEENELTATQRFDLEATEDISIDPELIRFLRLKFIEGKDAFILESIFMNTVYTTLLSPFSKPNEIKVFEYIISYCNHVINNMNSIASNNDDTELINSNSNNNIDVLFARLRVQERAALEQTIKLANEELTSINSPSDPREYYQERRLRELDLLRPLDDDEVVMPGDRVPVEDDYYT